MRRINMEANDENVLKSIQENTLDRNKNVKEIIEAIETVHGNFFICLDAEWGSGKTFFVRQTEKTLEYLTQKIWRLEEYETEEEFQQLTSVFGKTILDDINLKQSYLPIYYNAWLYDNHDDPLMSLIYVLLKKTGQYVDTKIEPPKKEKLLNALSSLSLSVQYNDLQITAGAAGLKELFASKEVLEKIKTTEDTKSIVEHVFDTIICETAQKLVIFVDELDRCRPYYAIEMLERIKHYIDDERIIIVFSMNKAQLVHTVKKIYGTEFDASAYLNRFFDISLHLPRCNTDEYLLKRNLQQYTKDKLMKLANELKVSNSLSIREQIIYLTKIQSIIEHRASYENDEWTFLVILIACYCLLDIRDVEGERKLARGEGEEIIKRIICDSKMAKRLIAYFVEETKVNEESFERGWEEFVRIYKFVFRNAETQAYYPGKFEIGRSIRNEFLRLCNFI